MSRPDGRADGLLRRPQGRAPLPRVRFVELANSFHVTAPYDWDGRAAALTGSVGGRALRATMPAP
jgi:hypothetical protein